jgi:predicted DNA-binding protein (MmcQ/YjbR family)
MHPVEMDAHGAETWPGKADGVAGTYPLDRLRLLCLAQPQATERLSHGEPTWFVRDKRVFAMFADEHHDDRVAVWLAAAPGAQEALVGVDGGRFFRPPYVGVKGWLGVYLDVDDVDWAELEALVGEAYRLVDDATRSKGRAG